MNRSKEIFIMMLMYLVTVTQVLGFAPTLYNSNLLDRTIIRPKRVERKSTFRQDSSKPVSTLSLHMLPSDPRIDVGPSWLLAQETATQASTYDPSTSSSIEGLSPLANTIVFIIGIIPFLWATYEFWSRIAVGASFGTGADSIQIRPSTRTIGEDGNPLKSRGQQVLGDDALVVAYILFGVAIASVGIAVYSVISSAVPDGSTSVASLGS